MTPSAAWIHRPKQIRSANTLDRIVAATRALLDEKSFGQLSVAEIMDRAGMSVGTFYLRFRNKQSLLPYLYEHYDLELERSTSLVLGSSRWVGLDLAARVRRIVAVGVDMYRAHRGLWRAMLIHASADPTLVTRVRQERRKAMVRRIGGLLMECGHEITHPSPKQAVEFCLVLLFATCKDRILLEERSHGTSRMSDARLKRELTVALKGYLGIRPRACRQ